MRASAPGGCDTLWGPGFLAGHAFALSLPGRRGERRNSMSTDDMIEEIEDLEPAVPRALVVLAEGAEEAEAVIIIDVLRRAGIEVVIAALGADTVVQCSRKVRIAADLTLSAVTGNFDAL